jgi:UTP--glucose-1-phosphate uridylyltransferase
MNAGFKRRFALFRRRMREAAVPEIAIRTFRHYFAQLLEGETGLVAEADIAPVATLPDADDLDRDLVAVGRRALAQTVTIRLNGGLGTSMGLAQAKSLITVKDQLSFLAVVCRQSEKQSIPLLLMNSFATREDSLRELARNETAPFDLPADFLQHKVPKVNRRTLEPVRWPDDPDLEWCPPGHGDLYTALLSSTILDRLVAAGYRYAFVANVDNLGAMVEPAILGYFVSNELPFLMEVADRTKADRKGGHLAQRVRDGRLILREAAQCPPDELDRFQDISRHRYFNTNNLWLDLPRLQTVLAQRDGILGLPSIVNRKTIDPRDPTSTPVYQLETAMGAAIEVFEDARALRVDRRRFSPVKTTNDLLAVRSDAYALTDTYQLVLEESRDGRPPIIDLDPRFYRTLEAFEMRFSKGPPSLKACERLQVRGDVRFGRGVTVIGCVELQNDSTDPQHIEDGAVLEG